MSAPYASISAAGRDRAVFGTVLCGLDGSPASLDALAQAAVLCAPRGELRLLAVTWEAADAHGVLSRWEAEHELSRARGTAGDLGLEAVVLEIAAPDPAAVLLHHASRGDLVAIGANGRSTGGGTPLGRTARALLAASPVPVLIARPAGGNRFGDSVLAAIDGTPSSLRAAEAAGRVAAATGGQAAIVSAPGHDPDTREILAAATAHLRELTGVDPVVLDESGAAERAVARAAAALGASLVVTGSRGLTGADAAHSVSERIAATADCSVLVMRGRCA